MRSGDSTPPADEDEDEQLAAAIRLSLNIAVATPVPGEPSDDIDPLLAPPASPAEPEGEPHEGGGHSLDRPQATYSWTQRPERGSGVRDRGAAAAASRGTGLAGASGPSRGSEQQAAPTFSDSAGSGGASSSSAPVDVGEEPRVLLANQLLSLPAPEQAALAEARGYAVWSAPGAQAAVVGVHFGAGCWHCVVRRLAGGQYRSGRDHLRGATGITAVLALYHSERRRWGAPREPVIFYW